MKISQSSVNLAIHTLTYSIVTDLNILTPKPKPRCKFFSKPFHLLIYTYLATFFPTYLHLKSFFIVKQTNFDWAVLILMSILFFVPNFSHSRIGLLF